MSYTHTAFQVDDSGRAISVGLVTVDDGAVVAANGHWAPSTGTRAFDAVWRSGLSMSCARVDIVPGAEAYRQCLTRSIAGVHASAAATGRAATLCRVILPGNLRPSTIVSVAEEAREAGRAELERGAMELLEGRDPLGHHAVAVARYVRAQRAAQ